MFSRDAAVDNGDTTNLWRPSARNNATAVGPLVAGY
jgi:hypothetical protein